MGIFKGCEISHNRRPDDKRLSRQRGADYTEYVDLVKIASAPTYQEVAQ